MGTYASAEALSAVVAAHGVGIDGRCPTCWTIGCTKRNWALLALGDRLPRRRPGATYPELVGARRIRIEGQR